MSFEELYKEKYGEEIKNLKEQVKLLKMGIKSYERVLRERVRILGIAIGTCRTQKERMQVINELFKDLMMEKEK